MALSNFKIKRIIDEDGCRRARVFLDDIELDGVFYVNYSMAVDTVPEVILKMHVDSIETDHQKLTATEIVDLEEDSE